jgi:hypothetical protein
MSDSHAVFSIWPELRLVDYAVRDQSQLDVMDYGG